MADPLGVNVYFPFLDGALSYDCARCTTRCCNGLGFGLGSAQLVQLLARRPEVAPFVSPSGPLPTVIDLVEGCWFLAADGRCRIELEDGRDQKPSICRLFPFTRVYRIEEITVVEPHLLYCPLEDARGTGVRHAELEGELATMGDEVPLMKSTPPPGLPDNWVERERAALSVSAAHLDDRDTLSLPAALGAAEALAALQAGWRRSFALDEKHADDDAAVARPMALLTPLFRFAGLLHSTLPAPYPRLHARLPAQGLATGLMAALATRALGRAPSLRSIGELYRATALVRELLIRWDTPTWLAEPAEAPPLPAAIALAYRRLVVELTRSEPLPLGAAFDAASDTLAPPLRFPLLRAFSNRFGALRFR